MNQQFCTNCKRIYFDDHDCGFVAAGAAFRQWRKAAKAECRRCDYWGTRNGSTGCLLSPTKPCDIGYYLARGQGCFADPPRFQPLRRIGVVVPRGGAWTGQSRGKLFASTLTEQGHETELIPAGTEADWSQFDLVCIHAMVVDIEQAAKDNPQTKFVVINHSALPHLETTNTKYVQQFADSLRLAKELPNVWYASQEPIADSLPIERSMWLPSPGIGQQPRQYREPGQPPTVVIAGRVDAIKNNLVQAIACSIMSRPVQLVLCTRHHPPLASVLKQLGVDYEWRGHLPHGQWLDFLRTEADLVLCCSLAESFCFVASEAMSIGVPVIASDAIRFADPRLLVNHTDATDIAKTIDDALDDYPSHCQRAAELGSAVVDQQRREYVQRIARLLDGGR